MNLKKLAINDENIDEFRRAFQAVYDFDLLPELPELLSADDLCLVFSISKPSVQKLIETGVFEPINIPGEAICFPKSEILTFIFNNFLVNKPILDTVKNEPEINENIPENE